MYYCPICGNILGLMPCADCGFDLSRCAEMYPTLTAQAEPRQALRLFRRAAFIRWTGDNNSTQSQNEAPAEITGHIPPVEEAEPDTGNAEPDAGKAEMGTEPDREETPQADSAASKLFRFGTWRQKDKYKTKKPIEWIVLEREKNSMLLISRYVLKLAPFHYAWQGVDWENSSLRTWLNGDFLYEAFSPVERKQIQLVQKMTEKKKAFSGWIETSTYDKVFILSKEEAVKAFPNAEARCCTQRPDSTFQQATAEESCGWWLRSPGGIQSYTDCVDKDGSIVEGGLRVNTSAIGVRPVIRIKL